MGIYDREYVRDGRGGGGFGGGGTVRARARLSGWSFNTWLIAINQCYLMSFFYKMKSGANTLDACSNYTY